MATVTKTLNKFNKPTRSNNYYYNVYANFGKIFDYHVSNDKHQTVL